MYSAQKNKPIKDDWYLTVQKDKEDLRIVMNDDNIKQMKKEKYKKLIKEKVKIIAFENLMDIKSSHSKGKEANFQKLEKQKYIKSNELTRKQKHLLFNLRFRMANFKMNFKEMNYDKICDLCRKEEDTGQHSLECTILIEKCPELYNDRIVKFEDIFGKIEKQVRAIKLLEKVLQERDKLLNNN